MDITTVQDPTAASVDREAVISLSVSVTDDTAIGTILHRNGATITVGVGPTALRLGDKGVSTELESLDLLARFFDRCLVAIANARPRAERRAAEQLPCGGVCRPVMWPEGAWCCGESGCSRHDGHDGDHLVCEDVDGVHTTRRFSEATVA